MKPLEDPEETRVVVEAVLHEIVETVGGERCPLPLDRDHEHALARVESRAKAIGRALAELRRIFQLLDIP